MIALLVIVWVGLALATGAAAKSRGRDATGWFLLALIVSPVIALILLMAFQPRRAGPSKLCKFCRSQVARDATVCPHCQRDIAYTSEEIAQQKGQVESDRIQTWALLILVVAGLVIAGILNGKP
jgi:hypothetical protein